MSCAIAAFCKTVGLSPVKTRLAQEIGKNKAEEFYQLSCNAVQEVLRQANAASKGELLPYWAVAEQRALNLNTWGAFQTVWTGGESLGKCISNVLSILLADHKSAIIIGTDSPAITPNHLLNAANALRHGQKHCVIGPCTDGGFYLFGCSSKVPDDIWLNVQYSRSDTLARLESLLKQEKWEISYLPVLGDVDVQSDLKNLYKSLSKINPSCNTQAKLSEWLKENI